MTKVLLFLYCYWSIYVHFRSYNWLYLLIRDLQLTLWEKLECADGETTGLRQLRLQNNSLPRSLVQWIWTSTVWHWIRHFRKTMITLMFTALILSCWRSWKHTRCKGWATQLFQIGGRPHRSVPAVPDLGLECWVDELPGRGVSQAASPQAGDTGGSSFCTGNLQRKKETTTESNSEWDSNMHD